MFRIDNIIVDQCKINIVDRYLDFTAADIFRIKFLRIDNIGIQDTCKLLFQDLISCYLKIMINRQINIISCRRFHMICGFNHFTHVINKYSFASFFALKPGFHGFFNAKLPYRVIQVIRAFSVFILKFFEIILIYLTGISDNLCEIDTVHIFANRIFHNRYPFQFVAVFHDHSNRFFIHIRCNGSGDIFLKGIGIHVIADRQDLQYLIPGKTIARNESILSIRLCVLSYPKSVPATKIVNNLLGCGCFFFFFQFINGSASIDICKKSQQSCSFHGKNIIIVFVQNDLKVADSCIPILFKHFDQCIDGTVQVIIFHLSALIDIFYGHRISQFIISQKITVSVINAATTSRNRSFFHDLCLKRIQICFSIDNLQIK